MLAKGYTGTVEFDGQFVTIKRTGMARFTIGKGDKRFHVRNVSAVQLKPAGPMVNGFIQFTIPGGNEQRSRFGSQTHNAARDENSVIFTRKQQPAFEQLRSAVEAAIAGSGQLQPVQPQNGLAGQLQELARLHQSGVLSDAEFGAAKARLLSQ